MGPNIYYLTKSAYQVMPVKSDKDLFICTDTHEFFKGEQPVVEQVRFVESKPDEPIKDVLYIVGDQHLASVHDGSKWIDLTQDILDRISSVDLSGAVQEAKDYTDSEIAKLAEVYDALGAAADAETAAKAYADEKDTATLNSAKTYADEKDGDTLNAANAYADTKAAAEANDAETAAKAYADEKVAAASETLSGAIDTSLAEAKAYTDDSIAAISGALHFRGVKTDTSELPSNAENGDIYLIGEKEFAWNGTQWVELGYPIDLSGYYTKDQIDDVVVPQALNDAATAANAYADAKAADAETAAASYTDEKTEELHTELESQIGNTESSLNNKIEDAANKANADLKAEIDKLPNEYDALGSADAAEDSAKDYADEKHDEAVTDAFDNLFKLVKAAGYTGTKTLFVSQMADVLNHTDKIMINEDENTTVATVNGTEYTSIADAFAAVQSGETLVLENNVKLDKAVTLADDVTLDFNGNMIEMDNKRLTVDGGNVTIKNANIVDNSDIPTGNGIIWDLMVKSGSLTIEDSSIDTRTCQVLNVLGGDVTFDNVELISSLDADYAATKYDSKTLIDVGAGATFTFKSGSIDATTSNDLTCGLYGITATAGGTVIIGDADTHTGPTIITNSAPFGNNNLDKGVDTFTIYGGKFISLMEHNGFMGVFYCGAGANINISGGYFDGGDYDLGLPYGVVQYNVNISGGEFKAATPIKLNYKNGGTQGNSPSSDDSIVITGGTFGGTLPDEYIADGYYQNDDGAVVAGSKPVVI